MEDKSNERHIIEVHPELIELLEKLRKSLKDISWNILDENVSWKELTGILARKIKAKGIV